MLIMHSSDDFFPQNLFFTPYHIFYFDVNNSQSVLSLQKELGVVYNADCIRLVDRNTLSEISKTIPNGGAYENFFSLHLDLDKRIFLIDARLIEQSRILEQTFLDSVFGPHQWFDDEDVSYSLNQLLTNDFFTDRRNIKGIKIFPNGIGLISRPIGFIQFEENYDNGTFFTRFVISYKNKDQLKPLEILQSTIQIEKESRKISDF